MSTSRKRGRPATGINPVVGVRLPPELLDELDHWRAQETNISGRPEAIRRLIEAALSHRETRGQPLLSPEQSRAARAWLGWSQSELAKRSNLSLSTVHDFERGQRKPTANNLSSMRRAIEAEGIKLLFDEAGAPVGIARKGNRIAGE